VDALGSIELLSDVADHLRALTVIMRKHRFVVSQQICECGGLPMWDLPMFGPRCEVAFDYWVRAYEAMRCVVSQVAVQQKVTGRAVVRGDRRFW
jgi:hypothetical protein